MEKDKDIDNYLEVIKDVTDASQRDNFIQPLRVLFARPMSPVFYSKINRQQAKKNDLKRVLREGILRSTQVDHYNAGCLLNERSIIPLRELLGSSSVRELKSALSIIRNHLTETIEKLPD